MNAINGLLTIINSKRDFAGNTYYAFRYLDCEHEPQTTFNHMKPEAQRIAIAKACGWDYHNRHPIHGKQSVKSWYYRDSDITVSDKSSLPDYLNDLNAMHEVEKSLDDVFYGWGKYLTCLGGTLYECAHATSSERAEAFLRTIGKWEGGE